MKHKEPEEGAEDIVAYEYRDQVRFVTNPEEIGIITGFLEREDSTQILVSVAGEERAVYHYEIMHKDKWGFGSISGEN